MMVDFMHSVVKEELERLHRKHYGEKSTQTKCVLHYLQSKLDDHSASKMERDAATRKRRMDHWERQFLQEALSEVY